MKTTGRCARGTWAESWWRWSRSAGSRMPRIPTSLSMAAVVPLPQKMTTVSSSPLTDRWIWARASSRSRVVCSPVPLLSVWVLA